ncbi:hypothetical protein [Urbifossiella limnaea]|uniref:Uncharacterized protein n=1 Tax=Urbifossiella limnaea TaxID=2528023 RepID=A0A517XZP6_9BACT|nr:hypothetical protein [Urbifossiella limnaea]QDU22985.1 hypothetical protein ETAA1_49750 [Urbifossiella limnaea]
MSIPIQDQALAAVLGSAVGVQHMIGPDGKVLGRFIPEPRPGMAFPEFGVTDEELARELADPNAPRFTAEQVMARLREIDQCTR